MASIQFTSQLERFLSAPASQAAGDSLGEALEGAMQENPKLRSYVFDDQGGLRQHVAVFVDGVLIQGEGALEHPLQPESEIYVMQALSGG